MSTIAYRLGDPASGAESLYSCASFSSSSFPLLIVSQSSRAHRIFSPPRAGFGLLSSSSILCVWAFSSVLWKTRSNLSKRGESSGLSRTCLSCRFQILHSDYADSFLPASSSPSDMLGFGIKGSYHDLTLSLSDHFLFDPFFWVGGVASGTSVFVSSNECKSCLLILPLQRCNRPIRSI